MKLLAAFVLSLGLLSGGCATPDGRFDPGATLGLAAGLAALGGLAYLATQDTNTGHRGYSHGGGGGRRSYRR